MDTMLNPRISVMLLGATLLTACAGRGDPQAAPSPAVHVSAAAPAAPAAAAYSAWSFFVSWTGERGGTQVTGMSEVVSTDGPIRQWADVLALAASVRAANPGLDNVKIVSYALMRIE